jgi:hypothetical protein
VPGRAPSAAATSRRTTAREAPRGRLASVRTPWRRCEIFSLCVDAPDSFRSSRSTKMTRHPGQIRDSRSSDLSRRARRLPNPPRARKPRTRRAAMRPHDPRATLPHHLCPSTIDRIDKEANKPDEERETGLLPDRAEILTEHRDPSHDPFDPLITPVLEVRILRGRCRASQSQLSRSGRRSGRQTARRSKHYRRIEARFADDALV